MLIELTRDELGRLTRALRASEERLTPPKVKGSAYLLDRLLLIGQGEDAKTKAEEELC